MANPKNVWTEDKMVENARKQDDNAPNQTTSTTRNVGGKTEINKTEGGTKPMQEKTAEDAESQARAKEDMNRFLNRLGPDKTGVISQEDADKAAEQLVTKTEEVDGVKTRVSSISEDALTKHKEVIGTAPTFRNETQSLTGVPGNVNLTQDGRLASDKSLRTKKTLEEINKEIEETAGPNPTPLREGNEITKGMTYAAQNPFIMSNIDNNTNAIADQLKGIREELNLNEEQQKKLDKIEEDLRKTGRVA